MSAPKLLACLAALIFAIGWMLWPWIPEKHKVYTMTGKENGILFTLNGEEEVLLPAKIPAPPFVFLIRNSGSKALLIKPPDGVTINGMMMDVGVKPKESMWVNEDTLGGGYQTTEGHPIGMGVLAETNEAKPR